MPLSPRLTRVNVDVEKETGLILTRKLSYGFKNVMLKPALEIMSKALLCDACRDELAALAINQRLTSDKLLELLIKYAKEIANVDAGSTS